MSHPMILDIANAFLHRGWTPLPIPYQSKNPNRAGWQRFNVTQNDLPQFFNGKPQNIGVLLGKPSGGLTDVDLDCPESITLAPYFLPTSNAVFGRISKPLSHYLYVVTDDEAKTAKFEDTDGKMLLELRYTGCQTIFPGSTHPSGEKIEWHMDGEPSHVAYAELLRTVRRMAAACLIVRHYPAQGSRNDLSLALAGGLLRAGWSEQETAHFIGAICTAAQDEETQARVNSVIGTAKKLANGQHVTGWPTLANLITDAAVERIRLWLELGETNSETQGNTAAGTQAKNDDAPLSVVCMADVEPEQVSWLWHPYIAIGKLTILEGDPGLGKSWLTCAIACAVSRGRGLPGAEPFKAGNVLMLSAEDGLGDTLRPRLDAVEADVHRIYALNEPLTFDAGGLLRLEASIIEHAPVLVIIDPLFAFTGGKVDIHRANECRAISAPLATIAERHGCAMLAVRHLGKSRGGGHALNAGIGSIDFTAAARSVLLVGRDPDDEQKRAVVQTKNNLAPHGEAIGYKLEGSQFYWTGVSDLTAGRILAAESDEGERSAITDAVDFLRTALSSGWRNSKDVINEAKQGGIKEATLRRAKAQLQVRAKKVGMPGSHYQKWVWELPDSEVTQICAEDTQTTESEHLRASDIDKDSYSQHLAEDAHDSKFEHLREETCASSGEDIKPLTEEEAELAARLEYEEHLTREEAERRARAWFEPVPF